MRIIVFKPKPCYDYKRKIQLKNLELIIFTNYMIRKKDENNKFKKNILKSFKIKINILFSFNINDRVILKILPVMLIYNYL